MKLTNNACYNCHSTGSTSYSEENGFALVKCAACGLLYVNPRPSDEDLVQAHEYGVHGGKAALDTTGIFNTAKVNSYISKLHEIFGDELVKKRTWLDIGCGHGEFLLALNSASGGKIVGKGVEPNKRKQESARNQGLDVTFLI